MENQEIVLQVGVKILLKNKDNKYLFVRRNPKKYPEVGAKWDIVGGRIHPGTPLLENLKREIKEETQLNFTGIPKFAAAQDILRVPGRHVVRITYIGEIEGEPKIDEESLEAVWFTAEEIKTMDVDLLDSYFKDLLDKNLIEL